MKKIITIIVSIVAVIALAGGLTFSYFSTRFKYNSKTAVGNTAGNLNNKGRFCEYDGKIYFANPYDDGRLYVMDSYCSNARALNTDSVYYINVCGNYIYYVRNNLSSAKENSFTGQMFGVYRTDLDGQNADTITTTKSGIATLYGNDIFYQYYNANEGMYVYKAGIDGKDDKKFSSKVYNLASVYNGKFYFADTYNKNYISTLDASTGNVSAYFNVNAYLVDAADNYIYYIDLDKGYALMRLNTSNKTLEQLYSPADGGKVINYNRYGNKIFFQVEGTNTGLYRMNADGTQIEYIAAGNISTINCTSQYTFFQYYEDNETLYRIPTVNPITKVEEITIKTGK